MYGQNQTPIPDWVKALSEKERRERGYTVTHSQCDGNPNRDGERAWSILVGGIGVVLTVLGVTLFHDTLTAVVGAAVAVGCLIWWHVADRHGEWYTRTYPMLDEEIAKIDLREKETVKKSVEVARILTERSAQIELPAGFSITPWEPKYPFRRPGEDRRAYFIADLVLRSSDAPTCLTLETSSYWVEDVERVIENVNLYRLVKDGIESLRERQQIVA